MESKNLSIMLTDIQGYSELSAQSSRSGIQDLVQTHNNLIRPIVTFYKGTVIKGLGDAFLCSFESATDAAVCSIAIQIVIQEYNRQQREIKKRLNIRIMINSGDVTINHGDIYGDPVNIVARMESLPEFQNGGIGISESTYLLMNRQEIFAESIGEHTLKGIAHPVKIFKLPLEKQKLTQLPTKLLNLVQHIASGKSFDTNTTTFAWKKPLFVTALASGLLLLVFYFVKEPRVFKNIESPPNSSAKIYKVEEIVGWLRGSPKEKRIIQKNDFIGPKELFDEIDIDQNGEINPREIREWAHKNNYQLPRPQQPKGNDSNE